MGTPGETLEKDDENPSQDRGPQLADNGDLAHSARETLLHLGRVAKFVLRVTLLMGIFVFTFFAVSATNVAPAIAVYTVWTLALMETVSATIEFTWFRMQSAVHWVISPVVVLALCIWLAIFPISAGSRMHEFAISCVLMSSFAGVREIVYQLMVHQANKPCVQRFCESIFGGVFYALTCVLLVAVVTFVMCGSMWWPETAEAGTWQSYLWGCLIVPIVLKAGSKQMGALGEIMIAGAGDYCADLIRCQFGYVMNVMYGLVAGWVIFSSPTFTQSWITLLSDIAIELLFQATTDKSYRAAWRTACTSQKVTQTKTYETQNPANTTEATTEENREKPVDKADLEIKPPAANGLTSEQTLEDDSPKGVNVYDPMLGEDPLDELETTVVSAAISIASIATTSLAIAIMVLSMHLYDRGEENSPINLLVLLVRFLAYTMEGYVLIVGAQHGHGKLLTYASLAKRWELLLDHDFASLLFYANTATNIVVYIVLGPVVLIVNAEDRAGSL